MSAPYNLDEGIQALLKSAVSSTIPVYKSMHVPPDDLRSTPNGYIFWTYSEFIPALCSEGFAEENGNESVGFVLDVACVAHDNARRKALSGNVLDVLQPTVSGRRTFLTSYTVPSTNVFLQYLRLESIEESGIIRTGQSNPDQSLLIMTFNGKATC
jgi:hypothetical protein